MKSQKELDKIICCANRTFYGRNVIPPCTLGVTLPGLAVDINQIITTQTIPNDVSDVVYNDLKEISQVGFRVNNDFDLMMIAKGFKSLNIGLQSNVGTAASQRQVLVFQVNPRRHRRRVVIDGQPSITPPYLAMVRRIDT